MKVVSAQQMREIDRRAIEGYGIPGVVLMENAGLQVVRVLEQRFSPLAHKKVAVIAGRGNNGGDGFVIARHLFNRRCQVKVYLLGRRDQIRGDARTNLEIISNMGLDIREIISLEELDDLSNFDLLIDAILGTGISSAVEGFYREVIDLMNDSHRPIISVDIPSGLSSDTGQLIGPSIKASITVTFGLPKISLLTYPAAKQVGELIVADIGLPRSLLEEEDIKVNLLTPGIVRGYIPSREPDAHKGDFGHLLIIAGSWGKTGAAAMAGQAALRAGAGLVTLALPKSLNLTMETTIPEVMTLPLPETTEGTIDQRAKERIYDFLDHTRIQVVVMGPGLTTHPSTSQLVRELVEELSLPVVLDADGINAICSYLHLLRGRKAPLIMTPHPGEMARLCELSVQEIQKDRLGIAQRFAQTHKVHLVLKGAISVIADEQGVLFLNPTGNPGMATGGMGDVLTGMVGSFIAQGWPLRESVNTAVYLHGLAGDLASQDLGPMGLTARDLIDRIPLALKTLMNHGDMPDLPYTRYD